MVDTDKFKDCKNVLVAGAGGVAGFVADVLVHCIKNKQLPDDMLFTFVDYDMVEKKNILYQNFVEADIGEPKAVALEKRYTPYIFGLNKKITSEDELKEYDGFIIGVDSNTCRKLIVEHCAATNKPFIEGRSEGSSFTVLSDYDGWTVDEYTKTLGEDGEGGSCQLAFMLEQNQIDLGNRIVAPVVVQVLLNRYRGLGYPKQLNVTI